MHPDARAAPGAVVRSKSVGFPQVRECLHGPRRQVQAKPCAISSQAAGSRATSDALVDVDSPTDPGSGIGLGLNRRFPVDRDLAKIILNATHSGERELANLVP